jgi:hypothetical protein
MDFLCSDGQLKARGRFSASETKMRTKTQIQKVSGQPSKLAPEISLIAFLAGAILLRVVDICAATPAVDPACTPTPANRALISCAVRGDQTLNALPVQASIR